MKAPAFQFYVRDWILSRSVQKMSGEEVKAYVYLLCEAWLEVPRATLPNDDEELSRMAQISLEKWLKIKGKVMANFELKGDRLVNIKLLEISGNQSKFQKWGKLGGNPHLSKNEEFEPKQVNPMVNPMVNGGVNPLVNLATAAASAAASSTLKQEEVASLPTLNLSKKSKDRVMSPFVHSWSREYLQVNGTNYIYRPEKDEKASEKFISHGISVESVIEVARHGWASNDDWTRSMCSSIASLNSNWNTIQAKFKKPQSQKIKPMRSIEDYLKGGVV